MKQVVQNYRSGELAVVDVPPPSSRPGGLLVATRYSLISTGTELMKVGEARLSLIGKARQRPDQVRKVVESAVQLGPAAAYQKAVNRLDSYSPLGYSLCGEVIDTGGEQGYAPGDLVACAGNEHALHAEVNWVPANLCVPVPQGVDPRLACFATVGAIALHGVRRAEVQLGETACVVGLGLIGQLVVRLLAAAGVGVVGIDPVDDRRRMAVEGGALACGAPGANGLAAVEQALAGATGGLGADYVFLAAGGSSNDPVRTAAHLARDRARVVDIGKCRLDLPWTDYYDKELEVRFSRSYGPGRYDPRYELDGIDYPAGYVRWTERRNLACFLDLVATGRLDLAGLVSGEYPLTEAVSVYERLSEGSLAGIGFVFSYPAAAPTGAPAPATGGPHGTPDGAPRRVRRPLARGPVPAGRAVRVGFVGAGNYASSMLLPHLARRDGVDLVRVATSTPLSAANARRRFGFHDAVTDASAVVEDGGIDAVFVVTRHSSHAQLAARALRAGKAVFVEKPLAIDGGGLALVLDAVAESGNDRLMVGFNRRFSPLLRGLRDGFGSPDGPSLVRWLVNAGRLDPKSWYASGAEGSRFEGEGGHFIDTASWWLGAEPTSVQATATGAGDLLVTLAYGDGSAASVAYATSGSSRFPKETLDVLAGGRGARLDNFRRATVWTGRRRRTQLSLRGVDKGQAAELAAFLAAVRTGSPMPIPLESLVATTRATLAVAASLSSGRPEPV